MLLRLAERLEMPLRERNRLLLAGGYAPIFAERGLDRPDMKAAMDAVRAALRAYEPSIGIGVSLPPTTFFRLSFRALQRACWTPVSTF